MTKVKLSDLHEVRQAYGERWAIMHRSNGSITLYAENKKDAEKKLRILDASFELLENLERILDRIEENEIQNLFPSAYDRAKKIIEKL